MSKINDIINQAEGARQCGNLELAVALLLDFARETQRARTRVTPEEFGTVWDLWRRGESVEKIASSTGYTVARVATIARKCKRLYPHDLASYRERTRKVAS